MKDPGALMLTPELRLSVERLAKRLGDTVLCAGNRWQPIAAALGLAPAEATAEAADAVVIIVGSPADVEAHARTTTNPFGFVMPVANTASLRRGGSSWRDDATLALWRLGFSPINVDRILVGAADATVEMVIGDVRPIPKVAEPDQQ